MSGDGWTVYILRCADETLYTGVARVLEKRLQQHESGTGAKYTRGRGPFTLVYSCACESRGEAQRLEARIKSMSRADKLALIEKPR